MFALRMQLRILNVCLFAVLSFIYGVTHAGTQVKGARYIGCYRDTAARDISAERTDDYKRTTPQRCIDRCLAKGFKYAAVQAGFACFCGNSYGIYGSISESHCRDACSGDSAQTCGGPWANAVYQLDRKMNYQGVRGAVYIGCYRDSSDRDVSDLFISAYSTNTVQLCIDMCVFTGYRYAAVQAGFACFCGHTYGRFGSISESNCRDPCTGDKSKTCGGGWANDVYRIN